MSRTDRHSPELPGNRGQFGQSTTSEAYRPLRATQPVAVKPVVPRTAAKPKARSQPRRTQVTAPGS